uniref:(northern house mosquito) hypothetical protein n=1 Tax=Culex pipiens TaxID=7175 RepID=A0A8D8C7M9_CULPI
MAHHKGFQDIKASSVKDRSAAGSDDGLAERVLASVAAAQPVPGRGAQHPHAADEPPGQGLLRRVCSKGRHQRPHHRDHLGGARRFERGELSARVRRPAVRPAGQVRAEPGQLRVPVQPAEQAVQQGGGAAPGGHRGTCHIKAAGESGGGGGGEAACDEKV